MHQSEDLALVGGNDGVAGVISLAENRLLFPLKGGEGAITGGLWAHERAVISTSTGSVKIFESREDAGSEVGSFKPMKQLLFKILHLHRR